MDRLVECIPNFSEGRNVDIVEALIAAIRAVPGVFLIDQEMDHDHHRSVLTFVGAPDAAAEAAFQAAREAARLIDLRVHRGGHPRVGATDVIPFVPIRGVAMADCIALAKGLGERIGQELQIPVFLYERAASHPDRANLENIRRGGLDGLAGRMDADPAWAADFGPARLHPTAGATIVGARPPLIAYNINLQTRDLAIAKAIAKKIRFSGGGLPHLKAIGVELASRGLVQVSMNLTNFEETPIHLAYEAVRREAEERGVQIAGSELIGLVPQRALMQSSERYLKLERFDPTQILETRLDQALARESAHQDRRREHVSGEGINLADSLSDFLDAVSSGAPTPGGGSVAAAAGALGAALGVMVCRISAPDTSGTGAPAQSSEGIEFGTMEQRLSVMRDRLRALVQADAEAYASVVAAYRLPRTDPARTGSIATNLASAAQIPLETALLATEAATLLRSLNSRVKPTLASDVRVGLLMVLASVEGALENVRINLKSIKDQSVVENLSRQLVTIERSLVELKKL
jgi:glutamate formiminotransferase/formiminotetrahydrofolate cyclodeaminase